MGVTWPEERAVQLCPAVHSPLPFPLEHHPTKSSASLYQITGPSSLISVSSRSSHSVPLDMLGQDQWRAVNVTRQTNSKYQSPSRETNRSSANQEIPRILWPQGSLPHSQETAARPYPEPEKSSSCPPIQLLEDQF